MLKATRIRCVNTIRFSSKLHKGKFDDVDIDLQPQSTSQRSFGVVLEENDDTANVIDRTELMSQQLQSPYRRKSGAPLHGRNAHEARLLPETLQARTFRDQIDLNPIVKQAISNNILSLQIPSNVRRSAANYFVDLYRRKLHKPAKTEMEVDAHIASVFVQNYGSIYQSLAELRKRVGWEKFNPKRILDVGYGPATGIVALNDLMGKDFKPELKEAVILSSLEMQKRAKIILSRQLNEIVDPVSTEAKSKEEMESNDDDLVEGKDLIGAVMTKKIKIKTKLSKSIPGSSQYDLIILTHQLLKHEERFPIQIDSNLEHYLKLLSPGGHIVIIERGNPLGFETIARARQVMIRPENYPDEHGKIPRPYQRGSAAMLADLRESNGNETNEEAKKIMEEITSRYGEIEPQDLEFEPEILREMEKNSHPEQSYHLKIIAPCPHQRRCPLQVGNPRYYEYEEGKRLKFCNFQKSIMRPKFTIELKKGKVLATPWQEPTDGVGKPGLAKAGTGRPNGRNYEILNYSYLIAERALTDIETISEIDRQRQESKALYDVGSLGDNTEQTWPRIINQPIKRKGHVTFDLCGSSGQLEKWVIPKSFNKEIYHDARKACKGDLWGLEGKTKMRGAAALKVEKFEKLEKERLKKIKRDLKKQDREISRKYNEIQVEQSARIEDEVENLAVIFGHDFTTDSKRKDKLYSKRKHDINDQL
ncbi:hypothetical protein HG536_0E03720 [Torulaspora globosa]|uniref:37S ribosomal protein S22 n=1 Tax=Torulaspora globosa TaxID=48254 RepID=A0A7G3ZIX5_9SACH|nr:uncharacterized protein HG536_0E03720 [Torulaspora globosa]QLL33461.1 hypothetical protein HG536_0E03720 [Torulaspora globosa]